jgi:carboxyvinyl-carboxyphosphonate phosphorylmutase
VQELEMAGAAGLTIEDTLLPSAFGEAKPQLISHDEGIGKVKAALDARRDSALVIVGRTGAASITSVDDAIVRARAYEALGVDALMFTGVKTRADLEAIAAATMLPIVLGGATEEMADWDFLVNQRVRIAVQGHAPIAAATQAVFATLKAIREGASPRDLPGLATSDLMDWVTRAALVKQRSADFLGLKK